MKKIFLLGLVAIVSFSCQTEKTGFVDTEELLMEYNVLKDAKERFTAQNDQILADLQLKMDAFEIKGKQFQTNAASMSRAKQEELYNQLSAESQQLQQERQMKMGQLQMESQRVIDSLITKVKEKVKSYGKENGYTYIYGSNDAGSVLYGKEEMNLTSKILAEMNGAAPIKKEEKDTEDKE
ncbi:OmpH family outer membrane protein [Dokdonia sinensis]|uniref:OmpH family outer membrane protein n=1 Tax=Dokdonia sinensis TaxID=2479847 RepID=A0A3M0GEP1_9FLAO|nr:OmpH family outer membrane protein [Dokdonia sinensis]RMB63200.1 OmpH family outer membrane protein [Dokdonia sinensis]